MIRRTVLGIATLAFAIGAAALFVPTPAVAEPNCVLCPAVIIDCGPCAVLHPQTCKRCQYCQPIPNCQPS